MEQSKSLIEEQNLEENSIVVVKNIDHLMENDQLKKDEKMQLSLSFYTQNNKKKSKTEIFRFHLIKYIYIF